MTAPFDAAKARGALANWDRDSACGEEGARVYALALAEIERLRQGWELVDGELDDSLMRLAGIEKTLARKDEEIERLQSELGEQDAKIIVKNAALLAAADVLAVVSSTPIGGPLAGRAQVTNEMVLGLRYAETAAREEAAK